MTKSAALLAECSLARGAAGGCAWCGTALPARRRVWCSDRCSDSFWKNHWWSVARGAAKKRDKYRCKQCGRALPKRPSRVAIPGEPEYKAAMRAWRKTRRNDRLEVNHIVPCVGKHAILSCAHHLENLETLCVVCHKTHTLAAAKMRNTRAAVLVV